MVEVTLQFRGYRVAYNVFISWFRSIEEDLTNDTLTNANQVTFSELMFIFILKEGVLQDVWTKLSLAHQLGDFRTERALIGSHNLELVPTVTSFDRIGIMKKMALLNAKFMNHVHNEQVFNRALLILFRPRDGNKLPEQKICKKDNEMSQQSFDEIDVVANLSDLGKLLENISAYFKKYDLPLTLIPWHISPRTAVSRSKKNAHAAKPVLETVYLEDKRRILGSLIPYESAQQINILHEVLTNTQIIGIQHRSIEGVWNSTLIPYTSLPALHRAKLRVLERYRTSNWQTLADQPLKQDQSNEELHKLVALHNVPFSSSEDESITDSDESVSSANFDKRMHWHNPITGLLMSTNSHALVENAAGGWRTVACQSLPPILSDMPEYPNPEAFRCPVHQKDSNLCKGNYGTHPYVFSHTNPLGVNYEKSSPQTANQNSSSCAFEDFDPGRGMTASERKLRKDRQFYLRNGFKPQDSSDESRAVCGGIFSWSKRAFQSDVDRTQWLRNLAPLPTMRSANMFAEFKQVNRDFELRVSRILDNCEKNRGSCSSIPVSIVSTSDMSEDLFSMHSNSDPRLSLYKREIFDILRVNLPLNVRLSPVTSTLTTITHRIFNAPQHLINSNDSIDNPYCPNPEQHSRLSSVGVFAVNQQSEYRNNLRRQGDPNPIQLEKAKCLFCIVQGYLKTLYFPKMSNLMFPRNKKLTCKDFIDHSKKDDSIVGYDENHLTESKYWLPIKPSFFDSLNTGAINGYSSKISQDLISTFRRMGVWDHTLCWDIHDGYVAKVIGKSVAASFSTDIEATVRSLEPSLADTPTIRTLFHKWHDHRVCGRTPHLLQKYLLHPDVLFESAQPDGHIDTPSHTPPPLFSCGNYSSGNNIGPPDDLIIVKVTGLRNDLTEKIIKHYLQRPFWISNLSLDAQSDPSFAMPTKESSSFASHSRFNNPLQKTPFSKKTQTLYIAPCLKQSSPNKIVPEILERYKAAMDILTTLSNPISARYDLNCRTHQWSDVTNVLRSQTKENLASQKRINQLCLAENTVFSDGCNPIKAFRKGKMERLITNTSEQEKQQSLDMRKQDLGPKYDPYQRLKAVSNGWDEGDAPGSHLFINSNLDNVYFKAFVPGLNKYKEKYDNEIDNLHELGALKHSNHIAPNPSCGRSLIEEQNVTLLMRNFMTPGWRDRDDRALGTLVESFRASEQEIKFQPDTDLEITDSIDAYIVMPNRESASKLVELINLLKTITMKFPHRHNPEKHRATDRWNYQDRPAHQTELPFLNTLGTSVSHSQVHYSSLFVNDGLQTKLLKMFVSSPTRISAQIGRFRSYNALNSYFEHYITNLMVASEMTNSPVKDKYLFD